MRRKITRLKNQILDWYETLRALDEMPLRRILGDFYDEKERRPTPPRRTTKSRVEDLRPAPLHETKTTSKDN